MAQGLPFEYIVSGRWGHFADWVRKSLPFEKIGDLSFATLHMIETSADLICVKFEKKELTNEDLLKRCATLLKCVVEINLAYGYHLKVSYVSKIPQEIQDFPFRRYIDLIMAINKLSLAAMIRSQEGYEVHNKELEQHMIQILQDILIWVQSASRMTLAQLADHCRKVYDLGGYQYDLSIGMDMEHSPVQYI